MYTATHTRMCRLAYMPSRLFFCQESLQPNIPTRWDRMEIIKKINNNIALARDAKGREMVVFGKGLGFPATPYTLQDLSKVQRTFYDVSDKYFALLQEVPEEIFLAADDIAEDANEELDCPLNPNLPFILADHLNFAIQRTRAGHHRTHRNRGEGFRHHPGPGQLQLLPIRHASALPGAADDAGQTSSCRRRQPGPVSGRAAPVARNLHLHPSDHHLPPGPLRLDLHRVGETVSDHAHPSRQIRTNIR